jgi:DNA-directed RNA polymerase specialized sigma24 family protein
VFLGFILRIGIHYKLGRNRTDNKFLELSGDDDGDESLMMKYVEQPGPESIAEISDLKRRVLTAIVHCLPKRDEANLIIDHMLNGRTPKELADALSTHVSTIHMKKFRAMRKLKKCSRFIEVWRGWEGKDS